jgi:hypothetical protein
MLRFQPEGLLGDGSVLVKLTRRSVGALRQRRRSGTPDPPGAAV